MILALVVAVAAVALGLALGLFPGASRRTLGPLRTLALAAVIGVAVLHLLPEAFSHLGLIGLAVFALGLAVPRWLAGLRGAGGAPRLGLEFGFWGLLLHHVADGLALGVYSRLDEEAPHSHVDVLLALVLHTVPLVAVVSAGYARARNARHAISRSAALALASVFGILASRLVPAEVVEDVQAWIAAGVAGLLLHGMSHDMTEDLPSGPGERVVDLIAACAGLAIGWIGARLDGHSDASFSTALAGSLSAVSLTAALPVLLGISLGALLSRLPATARRSAVFAASDPRRGAPLGPELFLLNLVNFGWLLALAVQALIASAATLASRLVPGDSARPPVHEPEAEGALRTHFLQRLDALGPWAFAGIAGGAVIGAALPGNALSALGPLETTALIAILVAGLPFHALLAPTVAAVLVVKGLPSGAVLVLCGVGPLLFDATRLRWVWSLALVGGAALLFGTHVPLAPLPVHGPLAAAALVALMALVLARVYRLGFRGWLAPLSPSHAHLASLDCVVEQDDRRVRASGS